MAYVAKRIIARPVSQALQAMEYYQEQMVASHLRQSEKGKAAVALGRADDYYISEPELRKVLRTFVANDESDEVDMLDVLLHQVQGRLEARFPDPSYFFPRYPIAGVKAVLVSLIERVGGGAPAPLAGTLKGPATLEPMSSASFGDRTHGDEEEPFLRRGTKYVDGRLTRPGLQEDASEDGVLQVAAASRFFGTEPDTAAKAKAAYMWKEVARRAPKTMQGARGPAAT